MSLIIVVFALIMLMYVAYRGLSVILFAPVCALLAVLLTDPSLGFRCSAVFSWTRWWDS
jgi:H+/gluconate symporter-like permease